MGMGRRIDQSGETHLDGQSRHYQVVVHSTRFGDVFAWLPERFAMDIAANWQFIVGGGMPAIVSFISSSVFGRVPMTQYLTAQVWCGSSPLRFGLPLRFIATRSSEREVINPIKQLLKMSLPQSQDAGSLLIPPGPRLETNVAAFARDALGVTNYTGGDEITLFIGSYIAIPKIFIENIRVEFKGKLNSTGEPMESECDVRFATLYVPTAGDIDDWIGASGELVQGTSRPLARQ